MLVNITLLRQIFLFMNISAVLSSVTLLLLLLNFIMLLLICVFVKNISQHTNFVIACRGSGPFKYNPFVIMIEVVIHSNNFTSKF